MTGKPDPIWNPQRFTRIRKGWPKAPSRAALPAVSAELCTRIGQVAIGWAMFERAFNGYVQAMLQSTKHVQDGWQWREFSKRLALFRMLMRQVYAANENILAALERVCHEASDVHHRRSVILHGMAGSSEDFKSMQFTGRRNGKSVTHNYDAEGITDLACRIWLLSGDMDSLRDPKDKEFGLAEVDTAVLRAFSQTHHPDAPVPGAPPMPMDERSEG